MTMVSDAGAASVVAAGISITPNSSSSNAACRRWARSALLPLTSRLLLASSAFSSETLKDRGNSQECNQEGVRFIGIGKYYYAYRPEGTGSTTFTKRGVLRQRDVKESMTRHSKV